VNLDGTTLAERVPVKRWFLILVAVFFAWTTSALAETKVVVRSFSGPSNASLRRAVVKQLKAIKGVKVVDEAAAERVAKKRHASLMSKNGRREVAGALGVAAWVDGRVVKKGGKLRATIDVIDASSGDEAGSWTFSGKKAPQLNAMVKRNFKKELRGAFNDVSAPAASGDAEEAEEEATPPDEPEEEEEPYPASAAVAAAEEREPEPAPAQEEPAERSEPVAQAEDDEKPRIVNRKDDEQRVDGDEEEPQVREHSAIEARAGLAMLHRALKYNQAYSQNVGNYSLPAAPVADVGLRIYPAAFGSDGWAGNLGLDLHGQLAFGLDSETSDGTRYPTSYHEYDASFIGRVPISRHELHFLLGYKGQNFTMDDKGKPEAPVADVEYSGGRFGMGGRFGLTEAVFMGFDVAYTYLFGFGELASADWFPNTTGGGIEGQLYADIRLYKALDARLFAGYQRQFFDFHSRVTDTRVAGGAVDEYINAGLALGLTY
jgi:TolB-like protein